MGLACDGSHIPFKPKSKKVAGEYRNYKGWSSILVLAWCNSYHLFTDGHVGSPGRLGDNSVIKSSWMYNELLKNREAWLAAQSM